MSLLSCLIVPAALLLIISFPLDAHPANYPNIVGLEPWESIGSKSLCRADVGFDTTLGIKQVWCADGVEGRVIEANGDLFACRTVRFSVPFQDSDIDIAGGCIAVREGNHPDP